MVTHIPGLARLLSFIVLLLIVTTDAAALACDPYSSPAASPRTRDMALSVCENSAKRNDLSTYTASWPSDGQLAGTIPFQIRSCGDYYCNRATRFTLRSNSVTLSNGTSEIPLTVKVRQLHTGTTLTFPDNRTCGSGAANCPFQGAGRQTNISPDYCESCVNFELLITADLAALQSSGTLTQSGLHSGTLVFRIDQAIDSSNTASGDSGHERDVDVTIQLNVPDLLQISGLSDITMTQNSPVSSGNYLATHKFCVYRSGNGKFKIQAEGTGVSTGNAFRLSGTSQFVEYQMRIGRIGRQSVNYRQGDTKSRGHWRGNCPPASNNPSGNTNMFLEIRVNQSQASSLPAGIYSDTMTLIVTPN